MQSIKMNPGLYLKGFSRDFFDDIQKYISTCLHVILYIGIHVYLYRCRCVYKAEAVSLLS